MPMASNIDDCVAVATEGDRADLRRENQELKDILRETHLVVATLEKALLEHMLV